jgi:hypothetical protein
MLPQCRRRDKSRRLEVPGNSAEVGHYRPEAIGRHENVARKPTIGIRDDQRSDPGELAVGRYQRGPASGEMGRGREDRVLQQIFPIAGKGSAGHHDSGLRRLVAAVPGDDDRRLLGEASRGSDRQRLHVQRLGRTQEAKPRRCVENR